MKSIIKEIFYKQRGNFERIPYSERQEQLTEKSNDLYQRIHDKLDEKTQLLLKELDDVQTEELSEESDQSFVEGFKIGLLLAFEAFGDL